MYLAAAHFLANGIAQSNIIWSHIQGKRSRNSAPGHPALEELQQQMQGQMQQGQMQMQGQMQGQQSLQGPGGMQGQDMGQINMTNRHALYHFESKCEV